MRKITEIMEDISKARAAYRDSRPDKPEKETRPLSRKVKELQAELSATISSGSEKCPKCHAIPHGMIKSVQKVGGVAVPIFEIGCLSCARGSRDVNPERAVEKWNEGEYYDPKRIAREEKIDE